MRNESDEFIQNLLTVKTIASKHTRNSFQYRWTGLIQMVVDPEYLSGFGKIWIMHKGMK